MTFDDLPSTMTAMGYGFELNEIEHVVNDSIIYQHDLVGPYNNYDLRMTVYAHDPEDGLGMWKWTVEAMVLGGDKLYSYGAISSYKYSSVDEAVAHAVHTYDSVATAISVYNNSISRDDKGLIDIGFMSEDYDKPDVWTQYRADEENEER